MHIVHLTPYYAPAYAFGGVVRAVEGMATTQVQRGHKVSVLTTDALNQTSRFRGPLAEVYAGVHVIRVPNLTMWPRKYVNLSTPPELVHIARQVLRSADVLHIHEFRTVENLLALPVAARMGVRVVLSPHGTLTYDTGRALTKRLWDRVLSRFVATHIDGVIGLTLDEVTEAKQVWRALGKTAEFQVVPNGVDPSPFKHLPESDDFRARYQLGAGPVLLFMGRLHPRKGADVLARSFMQVRDLDAHLVIVGPDEGLRPVLEHLAQRDPRIVLTGYLDGDTRLEAFATADVLALPAVGEGLPVVVLEAMAAGLPVIVSPGCYLPEVAANGAGLEVPVDEDLLASAIRKLLSETKTRHEMGVAARQLAKERFSWPVISEVLERIYVTS